MRKSKLNENGTIYLGKRLFPLGSMAKVSVEWNTKNEEGMLLFTHQMNSTHLGHKYPYILFTRIKLLGATTGFYSPIPTPTDS